MVFVGYLHMLIEGDVCIAILVRSNRGQGGEGSMRLAAIC